MSPWARSFNRRKRMMEDLDQDIRDFIERETQDNIERGMPPEEAHYAALRKFGNVTRVKEETRDVWSFVRLEQLWQDFRFGLRQLRSSPGFTVVAVFTLALGIGANTAIFSVINAVMLRMLPVHDPEGLVLLASAGEQRHQASAVERLSNPLFKYLRERNHVLIDVAAAGNWDFAESFSQPTKWSGQLVSANFFSVLGVMPAAGRFFTADEDQGLHPVVVISYAFWSREYGRRSVAIGRTLRLEDGLFTIIGVAPVHFSGLDPGENYDLWVPITMQPLVNGGCECGLLTSPDFQWWTLVGRLKPGVSKDLARADLDVLFQQTLRNRDLSRRSEQERHDLFTQHVELLPAARGTDNLRRELSSPLVLLMGMVILVLGVACANVANLLLARVSARHKEISVRLALGGSRRSVVQQLLVESATLALSGGVLGVLFAYWGGPVLLAMMSKGQNQLALNVHPDPLVLAFTLSISLATALGFGLAPALTAARTGMGASLQITSRTATAPRTARNFGRALVVAQLALSLVLALNAGLMARTLHYLETFNPGFTRQGVLLFGLAPTRIGYRGERLAQLYRELREVLSEIHGVRSVTFSRGMPISHRSSSEPITVEGYAPRPNENIEVYLNSVGPAFFETMQIPLLAGRDFSPEDNSGSPQVAIISEAMARRYFSGRSALGGRFAWGEGKARQVFEIVGIVGDAKYHSLREDPRPTAYLYALQGERLGDENFGVHASNPASLLPQIRSVMHTFDSRLVPWEPRTLEEQVDESLYQEKLVSKLSSFFGVLALLLAGLGLYGITAYMVARRTNEIGIRIALGADNNRILGMVLREALMLAAAGVVVGLPCAWASTRLIAALLYGLKATDPITLSGTVMLMAAVTFIAGYLPALRATKVDPIVALRYE